MTKLHYQRKHKKKVKTYKLNNLVIKLRLIPYVRNKNNVIWLFSFVCGFSVRQVNDWLDERKNKRAKQLKNQITGKHSLTPHFLAIQTLKEWQSKIPKNDSILFICDSVKPDKQFKIYKKWFTKHEKNWLIDVQNYAFIYHPGLSWGLTN